MIKGLYFKLNMEKRPDKDIYKFFEHESKRTGMTKLELLTAMMGIYSREYLKTVQTDVYGEGCND